MKVIDKLYCVLIIILITITIFSKNSYAATTRITFETAFANKIADMLGMKIDQNGKWVDEEGWSACTQHGNRAGYSDSIVTAYSTFYNEEKRTIVSNSVGKEAGAVKKTHVDTKKVKKLAAALSLEKNVARSKKCLRVMCTSRRTYSISNIDEQECG